MKRITLDQPIKYEIRIPGVLNKNWLEWNGRLKVIVDRDTCPDPISILTITVDQAELHGLLRQLYTFGIPLISVVCKDYCFHDET